MGLIHAEIELVNSNDLAFAKKHLIGEDEIRRITVPSLVDSGSYMLAINENIQSYLQLPFIERRRVQLANSQIVDCDIVGPVELHFKNRGTSCRAMVLPGDSEVLLGSIPMEDLDVMIHPQRQELIVNPNYPDMAHTRA